MSCRDARSGPIERASASGEGVSASVTRPTTKPHPILRNQSSRPQPNPSRRCATLTASGIVRCMHVTLSVMAFLLTFTFSCSKEKPPTSNPVSVSAAPTKTETAGAPPLTTDERRDIVAIVRRLESDAGTDKADIVKPDASTRHPDSRWSCAQT